MTTETSSIESSWSIAQQMTASMHELAASEEWVKVLEIATTRHDFLTSHFEKFPVGPDNSDFYRSRIGEMLQGEEVLQQLALEARKQVMRSAVTNHQNHRAVGAYLSSAAR